MFKLPLLRASLALALATCVGCGGLPADASPGRSLEPAGRADLQVRLLEPSGASVAGWVTLTPSGRDAHAGDDGWASFPAVPAGPVQITARAPGFEDAAPLDLLVPGSGEATATLSLAHPPSAVLDVVVVDVLGAPIGGAQIEVDGAAIATTDGAGGAVLVGVEPGARRVTVVADAHVQWGAEVAVQPRSRHVLRPVLASRTPADAVFIGSALCERCHADTLDQWRDSAHARALRSPAQLAASGPPGVPAAFASGAVIDGSGGATVTLAGASAASWTAEVHDGAGATSGPLPVLEAYGGWSSAIAFAVQGPSERLVLPIGWSLEGGGFVPGWEDGWFDGDALEWPPGDGASFDLRCAGCHATGYAIAQGDGFALEPGAHAAVVERSVGCEACHGPASEHPEPDDGRRAARIHQPGTMSGEATNAACSRCHQRVTPDLHPLSASPGPPLDADGHPLAPWRMADEVGPPAPTWFPTAALSAGHRDQVGDHDASPHAEGWRGSCSACHDAHGSPHRAALRHAPEDPALCTACHRSAFPDAAAVSAHTRHPGAGASGPGCVDCHMARSGLVLARDPLTGVGETRDHGLRVVRPEASLAAFDAAGTDALPSAEVPVTACLDCHVRRAEEGSCAGPGGDPTLRATWEAEVDRWAEWEAR